MRRALTRRAFLAGIVGSGAVAVPLAGTHAAASTSVHWLYWLNPDWGTGNAACVPNKGQAECRGCYACVKHYQNKLFASAADAEAGRAHPGCNCLVEAAFTVDPGTYTQLFPAGTAAVDRRTPGVNELLAGSSAAPASTSDAVSGTTGNADVALAFTGSALGPLVVAGAGAVAAGVVMKRMAQREDRPAPEG